jgi:hypothetical protein
METAQGRRTSSHDAKKSKAEQLADVGHTVHEAHRYEALAAMPDDHFETAVATAKAQKAQALKRWHLRRLRCAFERRPVAPAFERGASGATVARTTFTRLSP